MSKPVISLQFGNFSNFVGSHAWNTYSHLMSIPSAFDDMDFGNYFREGQNLWGQDTFTPRLLIFDLKGNFGPVGKSNTLYSPTQEEESAEDISTWHANVQKEEQPRASTNPFLDDLNASQLKSEKLYDLDGFVQSWGDYSRLFYHPRSIHELEPNAMGLFSTGSSLGEDQDIMEIAFDEDFRLSLEECDILSGIKVTVDIFDGFGGFASSFITRIRDELTKVPILTFGMDEPIKKDHSNLAVKRLHLNRAFATSQLLEHSSLYIPSQPQKLQTGLNLQWHRYLESDFTLPFHSSAIISSSIESILLSTLEKRTRVDFSYISSFLNWRRANNIAHMSFALPLPLQKELSVKQTISSWASMDTAKKPFKDFFLTPAEGKVTSQLVFGCGFQTDETVKLTDSTGNFIPKSELERAFAISNGCRLTELIHTQTKYPIEAPFPPIINDLVNDQGFCLEGEGTTCMEPKLVPTSTHVFNTRDSGDYLVQLRKNIERLKFSQFREYSDGTTLDDFDEMKESLEKLSEGFLDFDY